MKNYAALGASLGMAIVAVLGVANASNALDAYTCTKSSYSTGGKNYGKALCIGGSSAVMRHKAMANCLASDGRTWVAEGAFVYRGFTSIATCGTAKVTYVHVISRARG
ncbi:hypothetical protein ACFYO5_35650 [Streptomyces sp. NPDC006259]|uniref:hypothetical protein n=1 Tax=Streptomyces sp. NPDC006259 TaxID=3364740 RepID=UPI00368B4359